MMRRLRARLAAWWTMDPEVAALHAANYRVWRVFAWAHWAVVVEAGVKLGPVTVFVYLGWAVPVWRWSIPVPQVGLTVLGRTVIDTGL